jgi:hypothetical protein
MNFYCISEKPSRFGSAASSVLGCYVLYVSPLYLSVGRIDPQRLCCWGTRSDWLRLQYGRGPCCHPVFVLRRFTRTTSRGEITVHDEYQVSREWCISE